MTKRMREIIALVMLIALIVFALGFASWYLFVGHGWNVTASNIDDRFGEMEGYAVVAFEGSTEPEVRLTPGQRKRLEMTESMLDDQNRGNVDEVEQKPVGEKLAVEDVGDSYIQKDAAFFIIRPEERTFYTEPLIVRKKDWCLGVFAVNRPTTQLEVTRKAKYLRNQGANIVVAVVKDHALIDGRSEGVDIVVCEGDELIASNGAQSQGALVVDSPYRGHVQVVIVSPSYVTSTKTLESI